MTTYNIDWQSGGTEGLTGKTDITLNSGVADATSTSLTLTGRSLSNWGEIQQENFIRLMENFASENAPNNPTIGQLWFNPNEKILFIAIDPLTANGQTVYDLSVINPYSLVWVQVWPASDAGAIFAGREEYNALATRINRVLGAPEAYPSLTANPAAVPASHAWGWGQTGTVPTSTYNLLPIFSDANTAQVPGQAAGPLPFDNTAWCHLVAVMHKAQQAVHADLGIVDPSDPDLSITDVNDVNFIPPEKRVFWGMINDGRGGIAGTSAHDIATSTNFEFGGLGLFPTTFLEPGWGARGFALKMLEWAQLNAAVTQLEAGRFIFPIATTELATQSPLLATTTIGAWGPVVQQTTTVTFATLAAAKAFFNTGGSLRLMASSPDNIVMSGGDQSWEDFLRDTIAGMQLDFYGFGKLQTAPSPFLNYAPDTGVSTNLGFYDLLALFTSSPTVTAFQKIFSENRSAATSYVVTNGSGVEVEARITQVTPACIMEIRVTYRENDGIADTVSALTSVIWSVKKDEDNMNAPELAHPTISHAVFTGTYVP